MDVLRATFLICSSLSFSSFLRFSSWRSNDIEQRRFQDSFSWKNIKETFRFEDKDFFAYSQNVDTPVRFAILLSAVILIEGEG